MLLFLVIVYANFDIFIRIWSLKWLYFFSRDYQAIFLKIYVFFSFSILDINGKSIR